MTKGKRLGLLIAISLMAVLLVRPDTQPDDEFPRLHAKTDLVALFAALDELRDQELLSLEDYHRLRAPYTSSTTDGYAVMSALDELNEQGDLSANDYLLLKSLLGIDWPE